MRTWSLLEVTVFLVTCFTFLTAGGTIFCSESVAVAIQFHEQEPLWKLRYRFRI